MTLVKLLRNCASSERICADCPGNTEADCANKLMLKAADEIEKSFNEGFNQALRRLETTMYAKAFVHPDGMVRWDSGCWVRYKLFEKCLEEVKK